MYANLEARLHDVFWAAGGAPAELSLLENFLETHAGTALELGCGSGRLMLPLLEKGFFIEGLDNSGDMLKLCADSCADHSPVLHHADMAEFFHWQQPIPRSRSPPSPSSSSPRSACPRCFPTSATTCTLVAGSTSPPSFPGRSSPGSLREIPRIPTTKHRWMINTPPDA